MTKLIVLNGMHTKLEIRLAKSSRYSTKVLGRDELAEPAPKSSRVISRLQQGGQSGHKKSMLINARCRSINWSFIICQPLFG